jgi:hypothetical protein
MRMFWKNSPDFHEKFACFSGENNFLSSILIIWILLVGIFAA